MAYNYEEAMATDIREYLSFELRPEDLEKGFTSYMMTYTMICGFLTLSRATHQALTHSTAAKRKEM